MAKAVSRADRVEIFIPRTSGNEADLFVGVNGVSYLLPRGKKSLVPPAVAAEVQRAMAAEEKMYETQEALRAK